MEPELMQPKINNNGTARAELVRQRINTRRRICELMASLQETAPHGRDYLGNSVAYERDLSIYRARFAILDKLHNEIGDEAIAIQTAH